MSHVYNLTPSKTTTVVKTLYNFQSSEIFRGNILNCQQVGIISQRACLHHHHILNMQCHIRTLTTVFQRTIDPAYRHKQDFLSHSSTQ